MPKASPERRRIAARIAKIQGLNGPGDPRLPELRRDLAEANLTDQIRAARERVATWPPFTEEQIARLTLALRGGGDEAT